MRCQVAVLEHGRERNMLRSRYYFRRRGGYRVAALALDDGAVEVAFLGGAGSGPT